MINDIEELIKNCKEQIKRVYNEESLPFIVAYSGGKDSSVVLQIFYEVLLEMKQDNEDLENPVYVINTDTMVENPLVGIRVEKSMLSLQEAINRDELPMKVTILKPEAKDSFWANIVGKGYPSPNQEFRWCTDRLKIKPVNGFINSILEEYGGAIVTIGTRYGESQSRDRVLDKRKLKTKDLSKHPTLSGSFVFSPIVDFTVDDVWEYLLSNESPFGVDNSELYKMYSDSAEECPLVLDENDKAKGNCGNSRFGCWACTLVAEDKSLTGFIDSGNEELLPLLKFRNYLYKIRDEREKRAKLRTRGNIYYVALKQNDNTLIIPKKGGRDKQVIKLNEIHSIYHVYNEETLKEDIKRDGLDLNNLDKDILVKKLDGTYALLGLGPYTMDTRKELLKMLLETELEYKKISNSEYELVTKEELNAIQEYWVKRGDWENSVSSIYEEVYGTKISTNLNSTLLEQIKYIDIDNNELEQLKEILLVEESNTSDTSKNSKISAILTKEMYHL